MCGQIGLIMAKKTFGFIAQNLADLGYEPVPIIRGEKRPAVDKWQAGGWEAHSQQYETNYTGLLTRFNPGVDIDVSDDELVQAIRAIVFDVAGCHEVPPPRRIGNAPRELLLFRTEEEFAKVSTAAYVLKTDKADANGKVKGSKVEILASGQQFVAYAIHPDTGKPYHWNGGGEPMAMERSKLVTLDEDQAKEIVARCEVLLSLHGQLVERKSITSDSGGTLADRIPNERQEADDPIMALSAVGAMPNPNLPFDDWLRVLYATKGALKEEGRSAFMRWSAKSIKHDQAFADREWQKARPTLLGAGSLIWMAKKLGWAPVVSTQLAQAGSVVAEAGEADDGVVDSLVWPHMSGGKTPKPLNTLENFAALSRFLGVEYRMNMMTGEEVVRIPGMNVAEGCEANSAVTYMMSQANLVGLPSSLVPEYMSMICAQNPFHPAQQWVESRPWDGVSRMPLWLATITARDESLKVQMMRRWAISAIAALYKPGGVSAHGVLTLLGDQGIGKTSWFLSLVPKGLGFAKDGMILRPDSPDSVRQVTANWLVELGELDATFRKSDIAALKAFITQASDTYRLPYARKNTVNPRRTVFFASVNDSKFLSDNTGNRRYWTIDCLNIDYKHQIDMQQFWAEVKTLYEAGESWFLDEAELASLNESNEQFMTLDPISERLETRMDWDAPTIDWQWRTATEVALLIGLPNPSRSDVTRVATYLHKNRGCTAKRSNGLSMTLVPPPVFA
jgi:hypothetical protein